MVINEALIDKAIFNSVLLKMEKEGINSLTDQEFKDLACGVYSPSFSKESLGSFLGVCSCMIGLTDSKQAAFDRLASWFIEREEGRNHA